MLSILLKAGIPVLAAGTGAALVLTAPDAEAVTGAWVDDPVAQTTLAPGSVTVLAHATSPDALSSMDLLVDDKVVATDTDLERNDSLRLASFTWSAAAGEHVLKVRAGKAVSQPVPVLVGSEERPPPTAAPTTTAAPSTTPSPTPSATVSPTAAATTAPPTTAPTTAPPAATKSPTPAPAVTPTIGSVTVNPRTLDRSECSDYTPNHPSSALGVTTSGTTTKVTVTFTRGGSSPVVVTLTRSGGSWAGSVTNGQLDPYTDNDAHTATWSVTARAYNGAAVRTQPAGTVTLEHASCKP